MEKVGLSESEAHDLLTQIWEIMWEGAGPETPQIPRMPKIQPITPNPPAPAHRGLSTAEAVALEHPLFNPDWIYSTGGTGTFTENTDIETYRHLWSTKWAGKRFRAASFHGSRQWHFVQAPQYQG